MPRPLWLTTDPVPPKAPVRAGRPGWAPRPRARVRQLRAGWDIPEGAGQDLGGFLSGLGSAAQQGLQKAQDLGQWLTQPADPSGLASDPQMQQLGQQALEKAQTLTYGPGGGFGTPTEGEELAAQRNEAIAQANPIKDVPVLGGVSTFAAQTGLDPTNLYLLGAPAAERAVTETVPEAARATETGLEHLELPRPWTKPAEPAPPPAEPAPPPPEPGAAPAGPSMGRGTTGVSQTPSFLRESLRRMYPGAINKAAVKESVQNSVDASRNIPGATTFVNVDNTARTVSIVDQGTGMTPQTMENVFVKLGGSEKPAGASGGMGTAIKAVMANGEETWVRSIGQDPATGKLTDSIMHGSSDDFLGGTMHRYYAELGQMPGEELAGAPPEIRDWDQQHPGTTGTALWTRPLPDASWSRNAVTDWVNSFNQVNRIEGQAVDFTIDGEHIQPDKTYFQYGDGPISSYPSDPNSLPTELIDTIDTPGAQIDLYGSKRTYESSYQTVHLLNQGQYQADLGLSLGGQAKLPARLSANIRPKVGARDVGYPWTPDRNALVDVDAKALGDYVKQNLAAKAIAQENQRVIDTIQNASLIGNTGVRLVDDAGVGENTQAQQAMQRIAQDPGYHGLAGALKDLHLNVQAELEGRTIPSPEGGGTIGPTGLIGLGVSDKWLGLNVPASMLPGGTERGILISPWNVWNEAANEWPTDSEDQFIGHFADMLLGTMIHEVAHSTSIGGHAEGFAGILTRIPAFLGSSMSRAIRNALSDQLAAVWDTLGQDLERDAATFRNAAGESTLGRYGTEARPGAGTSEGDPAWHAQGGAVAWRPHLGRAVRANGSATGHRSERRPSVSGWQPRSSSSWNPGAGQELFDPGQGGSVGQSLTAATSTPTPTPTPTATPTPTPTPRPAEPAPTPQIGQNLLTPIPNVPAGSPAPPPEPIPNAPAESEPPALEPIPNVTPTPEEAAPTPPETAPPEVPPEAAPDQQPAPAPAAPATPTPASVPTYIGPEQTRRVPSAPAANVTQIPSTPFSVNPQSIAQLRNFFAGIPGTQLRAQPQAARALDFRAFAQQQGWVPQPAGRAQATTTAPVATTGTTTNSAGLTGPQPQQAGDYIDMTRQAAIQAGIDPELFARQIQQESGFDPNAGSPAGARGIAQIVPSAHPGVNTSDPQASLTYAANLMKGYLDKYGTWDKALWAYNAGEGNLARGVFPAETQKYLNIILGGQHNVTNVAPTSAGSISPDQAAATPPGPSNASANVMSEADFERANGMPVNYSTCGPTVAAAFAASQGINLSPTDALAKARGLWNSSVGMLGAGVSGVQQLLQRVGVQTQATGGVDWNQIQGEIAAGRPVIVNLSGHGGHFIYLNGYDANTGQYHGGNSTGADLRGGSDWITPQRLQQLGFSPVDTLVAAQSAGVGAGQDDEDQQPTLSKHEATYKKQAAEDHCRDCSMFRKPHHCTLVKGHIFPGGTCDYFEPAVGAGQELPFGLQNLPGAIQQLPQTIVNWATPAEGHFGPLGLVPDAPSPPPPPAPPPPPVTQPTQDVAAALQPPPTPPKAPAEPTPPPDTQGPLQQALDVAGKALGGPDLGAKLRASQPGGLGQIAGGTLGQLAPTPPPQTPEQRVGALAAVPATFANEFLGLGFGERGGVPAAMAQLTEGYARTLLPEGTSEGVVRAVGGVLNPQNLLLGGKGFGMSALAGASGLAARDAAVRAGADPAVADAAEMAGNLVGGWYGADAPGLSKLSRIDPLTSLPDTAGAAARAASSGGATASDAAVAASQVTADEDTIRQRLPPAARGTPEGEATVKQVSALARAQTVLGAVQDRFGRLPGDPFVTESAQWQRDRAAAQVHFAGAVAGTALGGIAGSREAQWQGYDPNDPQYWLRVTLGAVIGGTATGVVLPALAGRIPWGQHQPKVNDLVNEIYEPLKMIGKDAPLVAAHTKHIGEVFGAREYATQFETDLRKGFGPADKSQLTPELVAFYQKNGRLPDARVDPPAIIQKFGDYADNTYAQTAMDLWKKIAARDWPLLGKQYNTPQPDIAVRFPHIVTPEYRAAQIVKPMNDVDWALGGVGGQSIFPLSRYVNAAEARGAQSIEAGLAAGVDYVQDYVPVLANFAQQALAERAMQQYVADVTTHARSGSSLHLRWYTPNKNDPAWVPREQRAGTPLHSIVSRLPGAIYGDPYIEKVLRNTFVKGQPGPWSHTINSLIGFQRELQHTQFGTSLYHESTIARRMAWSQPVLYSQAYGLQGVPGLGRLAGLIDSDWERRLRAGLEIPLFLPRGIWEWGVAQRWTATDGAYAAHSRMTANRRLDLVSRGGLNMTKYSRDVSGKARVIGTLLSGIQGFSNGYNQATASGASPEQALLIGLGVGGLEAVAVRKLTGALSKRIFERVVPHAQFRVADMLEPAVGPELASEFANNMVGLPNLQMAARSPMLQQALRAVFLAPGYEETDFRLAQTALSDWKTRKGQMARTYWATAILGSAFWLQVVNLALSGHTTDQNEPGYQLDLDMSHVYDLLHQAQQNGAPIPGTWTRKDKNGNVIPAYWGVMGTMRGIFQTFQEIGRASLSIGLQAAGRPVPAEIGGDIARGIPAPDLPGAVGQAFSARGAIGPRSIQEIASGVDSLGRPIDQPGDPAWLQAGRRVGTAITDLEPLGPGQFFRGQQYGDPWPANFISSTTGLFRMYHPTPISQHLKLQEQVLKDIGMDPASAQQQAHSRAFKQQEINTNVEAILNDPNLTPAGPGGHGGMIDKIFQQYDQRRTAYQDDINQLNLQYNYTPKNGLPPPPGYEQVKAEIDQLFKDVVPSGGMGPADLTETDHPELNAQELFTESWKPVPTLGIPQQVMTDLGMTEANNWLPTLGKLDPKNAAALNQYHTLQMQKVAADHNIDPSLLEDIVKSHLYGDGTVPELPGVSSEELDNLTQRYRNTSIDFPEAGPDRTAAQRRVLADEVNALAANGITLSPQQQQGLRTRVIWRMLPLTEQPAVLKAWSQAEDAATAVKPLKMANADGTPFLGGDPKAQADMQARIAEAHTNASGADKTKPQFIAGKRGGTGQFLSRPNGPPDKQLNDAAAAAARGNAVRQQALQNPKDAQGNPIARYNADASPNLTNAWWAWNRLYGRGKNLTNDQWQQFLAGTLPGAFEDLDVARQALARDPNLQARWQQKGFDPSVEFQNRTQLMDDWAALTPEQRKDPRTANRLVTIFEDFGGGPVKQRVPMADAVKYLTRTKSPGHMNLTNLIQLGNDPNAPDGQNTTDYGATGA